MTVILFLEIWFLVLTNIMIHQGNWNDERHIIISETLNHLEQFLFLIAGKKLFKITHHMQENIYVLFHRRFQLHRRH